MKNILLIISAVLGILSLALFVHISIDSPIWVKVSYFVLYLANFINSIIANKKINEGQDAFNPILSLIAQLGLSFALFALVS